MAITDKLDDYKQYIIVGAMIMGILSILEFLPVTVDFFDLQENVKYIYIALIALGVFTFHKFYWTNQSASFDRTVGARNLSNPEHLRRIAKERGSEYMQQPPIMPQGSADRAPIPGKQVWDTFKRE